MMDDLQKKFEEAVEKASNMVQAEIPQDVQLRLYSSFKQATYGNFDIRQSTNFHLRDAFKTNAWMQVSHLTPDEAKKMYIEIIATLSKDE